MTCTQTDTPHPVFGIAMVALGVLLALDRIGVVALSRVVVAAWPLALMAMGAVMIARALAAPAGRPPARPAGTGLRQNGLDSR